MRDRVDKHDLKVAQAPVAHDNRVGLGIVGDLDDDPCGIALLDSFFDLGDALGLADCGNAGEHVFPDAIELLGERGLPAAVQPASAPTTSRNTVLWRSMSSAPVSGEMRAMS